MSRIGKRPVVITKGVTVKIDSGTLNVKGPKGELDFNVSPQRYKGVNVEIKGEEVLVTRREDTRLGRTEQGLVRALIQNMVTGVSEGYTRVLEIQGVGYRAEMQGKGIKLNLGFSHHIDFVLPAGITAEVDKKNNITLTGFDKQMVGETAARIRRLRPPEPYKGKGIRYRGEEVRRKVGKAAGAAGG